MSNLMEEGDELLGSGTEEAIFKEGYKEGFDEGSKEGKKEGWSVGLQTGADIGAELGKYKGFALAVREHLQSLSKGQDETTTAEGENQYAKSLKLCEKVIKLVDQFNWENVTSVHDASSQVRTQYNLLRTQLGVGEEVQQSENIPGQKFSF